MTFHVDSEVGQLKQVVLHRPGLELSRLTPQNVDELLFDDVMWAQRAREEHDAFAQKLRDKGVEVHLFAELLGEVLDKPGAGSGSSSGWPTRTRSARSWRSRCASSPRPRQRPVLAEYFIGGILKRDLQLARGTSPAVGVPRRQRLHPDPAAQPPVPARQHRLRLRGPVGPPDGQAGPQARDHPLPGDLELPPDVQGRRAALLLRQRRRAPPAGDRRGRRHPGHRQRRRDGRHGRAHDAAGHRDAARQYFSDGSVTKVIVVELPKTRAFMHLDTAMTMVDRDAFTVYPYLPPELRSFTLTQGQRRRLHRPRTTTCSRWSPRRSASTRSGC